MGLVQWGISQYIHQTVVRWPEATVVYHPFTNETLMLEGEVETIFTRLMDTSLSAAELAQDDAVEFCLEDLDQGLCLKQVEQILGELFKKDLIQLVSVD